MSFSDAVFLLKYDQTDGASIMERNITKIEDNFNMETDLICSFPEKSNKNSVYCFSLLGSFFHVWSFTYNNGIFSIVIVSRLYIVSVFLEFLENCNKCLLTETPLERYNKINSLLSKWRTENNDSQLIYYCCSGSYSLTVNDAFWFHIGFDPSLYVQNQKTMELIWISLITNEGVLVVGDDVDMVSRAVLSFISLLYPLRYLEKYMLYTRFGDQRFADVISGLNTWKIVGTTNVLALERCKQFAVVICLPNRPFRSNPLLREFFHARTMNLLKMFETGFMRQMEEDPYSGILNVSLSNSYLEDMEKKYDNMDGLSYTVKFLNAMQKTRTFSAWRSRNKFKYYFRDKFLSFDPVNLFTNRSLEHLKIIEKSLDGLKRKYSSDSHMLAVIEAHLYHVKKHINKAKEGQEKAEVLS